MTGSDGKVFGGGAGGGRGATGRGGGGGTGSSVPLLTRDNFIPGVIVSSRVAGIMSFRSFIHVLTWEDLLDFHALEASSAMKFSAGTVSTSGTYSAFPISNPHNSHPFGFSSGTHVSAGNHPAGNHPAGNPFHGNPGNSNNRGFHKAGRASKSVVSSPMRKKLLPGPLGGLHPPSLPSSSSFGTSSGQSSSGTSSGTIVIDTGSGIPSANSISVGSSSSSSPTAPTNRGIFVSVNNQQEQEAYIPSDLFRLLAIRERMDKEKTISTNSNKDCLLLLNQAKFMISGRFYSTATNFYLFLFYDISNNRKMWMQTHLEPQDLFRLVSPAPPSAEQLSTEQHISKEEREQEEEKENGE